MDHDTKINMLIIASFMVGLISTALQSVALGTDFWVEYKDTNIIRNDNKLDVPVNDSSYQLVSHSGLITVCYLYIPQILEPNPECKTVNFTESTLVPQTHGGYEFVYLFNSRVACLSLITCSLILQVFALATTFQGFWEQRSILYTDAYRMYFLGALMNLIGVPLYLDILLFYQDQADRTQRHLKDIAFNQTPIISYTLDYSWSCLCCWGSFLLGLAVTSMLWFAQLFQLKQFMYKNDQVYGKPTKCEIVLKTFTDL